jgi:hypothetical protein
VNKPGRSSRGNQLPMVMVVTVPTTTSTASCSVLRMTLQHDDSRVGVFASRRRPNRESISTIWAGASALGGRYVE